MKAVKVASVAVKKTDGQKKNWREPKPVTIRRIVFWSVYTKWNHCPAAAQIQCQVNQVMRTLQKDRLLNRLMGKARRTIFLVSWHSIAKKTKNLPENVIWGGYFMPKETIYGILVTKNIYLKYRRKQKIKQGRLWRLWIIHPQEKWIKTRQTRQIAYI